jgi:hypothetical protein
MRAEAKRPVGRAWQIPEPIAGARVGWFAGSGLVFVEGRARPEGLCAPSEVTAAVSILRSSLARRGIVLPPSSALGFRRLDLAVDLRCDNSVDGLSILDQAAAAGGGKFAVYRADHCVETVILMTPSGKAMARVYDKGRQTRSAHRGRWLRFEAQWLFPRGSRPRPHQLGPEELRERFASRFRTLWRAAPPPGPTGRVAIARRLAGAIEEGQVLPSRARSLVGYLFLAPSGVPQGARRTVDELERECRELGLSLSLPESGPDEPDLVTIFESLVRSELWNSEL